MVEADTVVESKVDSAAGTKSMPSSDSSLRSRALVRYEDKKKVQLGLLQRRLIVW